MTSQEDKASISEKLHSIKMLINTNTPGSPSGRILPASANQSPLSDFPHFSPPSHHHLTNNSAYLDSVPVRLAPTGIPPPPPPPPAVHSQQEQHHQHPHHHNQQQHHHIFQHHHQNHQHFPTFASNNTSTISGNSGNSGPASLATIHHPSLHSLHALADEEVNLLKDNNRQLYKKIVMLEESLNNYIMKNRYLEEENLTLEEKLKNTIKRADDAEEKGKQIEREGKDSSIELQQQYAQLQSKYEVLQQKIGSEEKNQHTMDRLLKDLENVNREKTKDINNLKMELSEKHNLNIKIQQELDKVTREKKLLEDTINDNKRQMEKDKKELREKFALMKRSSNDQTKKLIADFELERKQYQDKLNNLKADLSSLHIQLDTTRKELSEIGTQKATLEQENLNLLQRQRFVQSKSDSVQEIIVQQKTQYTLLHQSYFHLQKQKEKAEKREKQLMEELDRLRDKVLEYENENKTLRSQNNYIKRSLSNLQQTVRDMNGQNLQLMKKANKILEMS